MEPNTSLLRYPKLSKIKASPHTPNNILNTSDVIISLFLMLFQIPTTKSAIH